MMNITTINEKMKRLGDRLIVQQNTLQCLNQECLLLKMSCEQTNACIKKMKCDQDEYLHHTSYDGTLIWKTINVDQKFAEAQSGKQTSIESPVFYSSPYGHHIIDSFDPDTKSSSFQGPTSEKNIASHDTMFIKIMLDFGETLREVLPYTLSVNRGLPTHIQEVIRCMKIEKYKQAREALIAEKIRNDQEI
ncbi:unnamed protein product [Rotaria sordida]|uniref:Uncharacterized protein n=1 Tax=Rotaria sordida TaxID=392033 RepID=A0A819ZYK6_9BILA|nr:unnamed protein product [Rotaria sordida]